MGDPSTATLDVEFIDGASAREVDGQLAEIRSIAIVRDLTASGTWSDVMSQAALVLDARGYARGQGHPDPNFAGMILRERNPAPIGPSMVRIELVWRPPRIVVPDRGSAAAISGGSYLEQVTEIKQNDGTPILLEDPDTRKWHGEVTVLRPRSHLTFERAFQSAAPGAHSEAYTGFVNSDAFQGDSEPFGRWLVTDIEFERIDADTLPWPTFNFRYSFLKKPNGHNPEAWVPDPETMLPRYNLVQDVGIVTVNSYFGIPLIPLIT